MQRLDPNLSPDLSELHRPVTGLFADRIGLEAGLGDAQLRSFGENGFVAGIRVLDAAAVDVLRHDLEAMMAPGQAANPLFYEYHHNESSDPAKIVFHALGAWRVSAAFHDLLFHPSIAARAEQLLGGPARFWHDQVFVKPARDGGVVAWHQDYSYWTRTTPMAHLTCWIGLDDTDEANGCVQYVPGSHRWDLLPRTDLANDMEAVLEVLTPEQKLAFRPVPIALKAGEASFHHPLMLHGSYENRSDRPRRAAVINFIRDGVMSDSDEPLLAGVPVIPKGQKLEGRFFPLLANDRIA